MSAPKTIDEIRAAFLAIHHVATGQSDRAYMSIPPDPNRDADLIVSAAIDELDELRAENKALSSPCPTCGSSLFDCADCAMSTVRILRAERDALKETLEALRARGGT